MAKSIDVAKLKTALKWASFASTMSWVTWVPRLPEIKDHLGLTLDQLGTILMVTGLTMAFAAIGTITSLVLGALLLNSLNTLQYLMLIQALTGGIAIAVNRFMTTKDEGAAEKGTKQVKMPWFGKGTGAFWLALTALYATTLAEFSA